MRKTKHTPISSSVWHSVEGRKPEFDQLWRASTRRGRDVRAAVRLSAQQPARGRARGRALERRTVAGAQLSGGGAGAFRRAAARGAGNRAGVRSGLVPPLLLQPLVENAVKHGIASMVEGGTILLDAWRVENALHISVENPFDPEGAAGRRNGLGLQIVKRRLLARYGDRADMVVEAGEKRYRVEIVMPYETG